MPAGYTIRYPKYVFREAGLKKRPLIFGFKLGLIWGGAVFLFTWLSHLTGYGMRMLESLWICLYPGYSISPLGSLIGFGWGFLYGLIIGIIIIDIRGWLKKK